MVVEIRLWAKTVVERCRVQGGCGETGCGEIGTGISCMQEGEEAVKILRLLLERVDGWQCLPLGARTGARGVGSSL